MLKGSATNWAAAITGINATAYRDGRCAGAVTITELSFNDCQISSAAAFAIGERLQVHLQGQGWIEAEVNWISGDRAGLTFLTIPQV